MSVSRILAASLILPLAWVAAAPAAGQEEAASPPMYYVADYKVGFEDLPEWTRVHHEHAAPILDALVDEEIISGWSAWQHNTGSDYNWRLVIEAEEWADFGPFWDEYLERLPEDVLARSGEMIEAHRDQVWNQASIRIPDSDTDLRYAYEALYQIDFDDLEAWQEHRESAVVPVLEEAMEDGSLAGAAALGHDTGDRFNRAEVYFFESWDDIDDFWDRLLGTLMEDEAAWDRVAGMIRAHDDVIWERVPEPETAEDGM